MSEVVSNIKRLLPRSGMENWSKMKPVSDIDLLNSHKLLSHLRSVAEIPTKQAIWNRVKIDELKKLTKRRKKKFFFLFGLTVFVTPMTAALYLIGIACALSGNECVSTMPLLRYQYFLVVFSILTVGLMLWKRSVGRNHYKTDFKEYYHSDLTLEQKQALTTEILKLKNNRASIYEVGNYERVIELKPIFWKAENWFLIFTDYESDRSAIWLDRQIPLGELVIQNKTGSRFILEGDLPWDKLQQPNFKYIVSDITRLDDFIKRKKNTPLVRNQEHWLTAFMRLRENYADYLLYLEKKLMSARRKEFIGRFTTIFAEISNDKSKAEEDANFYEIGYKGATNFLRGRNTSMEDWINSP